MSEHPDPPLRYEHKYLVSLGNYHALRNSLVPWTKHDAYALRAPNHRYFVRSLYYDTWDHHFYHQKISGHPHRVKLRLRTYSQAPSDDLKINVELKMRQHSMIAKHATKTTWAAAQSFLRLKSWGETSDRVLLESERLARKLALKPGVLVDYDREALVALDDPGLRLTFDHAVSYVKTNTLFPERSFVRSASPSVVFEVKTSQAYPLWLQRIVKKCALRSEPNSKYVNAVEQTML